MFVSHAYAETVATQSALSGTLMSMLSLLLLFALLYFLMIRPQMKRQKEHRAMLAALSINDEIATTGGIMGRITALRDSHVEIEVTHGVIICIQRPSIAQVLPKGTLPKTTK